MGILCCVGETSIWYDAEDCSWDCVLIFTGYDILVMHKQINTPTDKT